jgi:hypothetical protein
MSRHLRSTGTGTRTDTRTPTRACALARSRALARPFASTVALAALCVACGVACGLACGDGGSGNDNNANGNDNDNHNHNGSADGGPTDGEVARDGGEDPPFDEAHYYVAPDGDDANPGTLDQPFGTLGRARQAVREHKASEGLPEGGLVVALRGGTYPVEATFTLGAEDAGDATAPVYWVGYPGEDARLSGGARIDPGDIAAVTSADPLWDRLPTDTRDQVVVVDLAALGLDPGTMRRRGWSTSDRTAPLEVVWDGAMLTLARWPNAGQTDPEDLTADAVVSGDIFGGGSGGGSGGTTFGYLDTTATGNADDGYPSYHANVGGTDYYLYHCTWQWGGGTHSYWFISGADPRTDPDCWPSGITSWLHAGDWPLPELEAFGGSAAEGVWPRTRPEDFAEDGFLRIPETTDDTHFRLPGTRHEGWDATATPWFQGLFHNYWADNTLAGTVDSGGGVTLADAPSYGLSRLQPFFVMNLPEELDTPGEYYVDFTTERLYVWPPGAVAGADVRVTLLEEPLVRVEDTAHLRLVNLTVELGRTRMVELDGVEDVILRDVTLRHGGGDGIRVAGTWSGLERCHLYELGSQAVELTGGHRPSLTRGELFVRNTHIHHWGRWDRTYRVAVRVRGCGHTVAHNHLHDAPHTAILYNGNEHTFEYNRIERVVLEAGDAGAIYTGRDWGYRGNVIRYNLIRDLDSVFGGAVGVYLDDASSGMTVFGNVIYNVAGLATQSGGGRDNLFENNVLVGAERSAHSTDRRAQTANYDFDANGRPDSWNLLGRINVDFDTWYAHPPDGDPIHYQQDPWVTAYPALAAIPNDWSQVAGTHWLDPEGSVFRYNVTWQCGGLISVGTWGGDGATDHYAHIAPNLEDTDPGFVDEANGDLTLRTDSPVYTTPGFVFDPIPFSDIGIEP